MMLFDRLHRRHEDDAADAVETDTFEFVADDGADVDDEAFAQAIAAAREAERLESERAFASQT